MSLPPLAPPRQGRPVLAFFDLDETLLTVNSGRLWVRWDRSQGRVGWWEQLRMLLWLIQYRAGVLNIEGVIARLSERTRGVHARAMRLEAQRWYEALVRPTLSAQAVARVEAHRAAGHTLVMLTGNTQFGAGPVAKELGFEHLLSTELEVEGGALTGRVVPPICFGDGKVVKARRLADALGAQLDEAWFYTDSFTDLPMLEVVGQPVAANPDPRLRRVAQTRGWPTLRFS